jgi:hypothetical protein
VYLLFLLQMQVKYMSGLLDLAEQGTEIGSPVKSKTISGTALIGDSLNEGKV